MQPVYLISSMKHHEKQADIKINTFEFRISPLQISFKQAQPQNYLLEFCKGPQILKRFSEHISLHSEQKTYRMENGECIEMKLQSERGCMCEWAVYRVTDDDMKEYITSVSGDLTAFYQKYISSIKDNFAQYSKLLAGNDGQNVTLEHEWPVLKKGLHFEEEIAQVSKENDIQIVFKVSIRCELDRLTDIQEKKKLERQLSRNSSKRSFSIGSKTYLEDPGLQNEKLNLSEKEKKEENIQINFKRPNYGDTGKKNEALSDIIEASSETSSLNHQIKGHGKMSTISRIPQQEENSPTFHPSIKTQNFDALNLNNLSPRKSKTMTDDNDKKIQKQVDDVTEAYESMIKSKIRDPAPIGSESDIKDDPFAELETAAPHSVNKSSGILPEQSLLHKSEVKKSGKSLILILFVLVIVGVSYFFFQGMNLPQFNNYTIRDFVAFVSRIMPRSQRSKAQNKQTLKKQSAWSSEPQEEKEEMKKADNKRGNREKTEEKVDKQEKVRRYRNK